MYQFGRRENGGCEPKLIERRQKKEVPAKRSPFWRPFSFARNVETASRLSVLQLMGRGKEQKETGEGSFVFGL